MQAELVLRIAADPHAVAKLEGNELCELLATPSPPAWVFDEAARRSGDSQVLAHLFSQPAASARLLTSALTYNTNLLDRLSHHLTVFEGELELSGVFTNVVPEAVRQPLGDARVALLLAQHLSPWCLRYLSFADARAQMVQKTRLQAWEPGQDTSVQLEVKPNQLALPRVYSPLARFVLLGDFLHYLSCPHVAEPRDLPVMAKVALALNPKQAFGSLLDDADVRVRLAARVRQSWNAS